MPGTVIAFYSYKGGTGRSMALANVACLLARRSSKSKQPRVLAIDWDLEAPGLHRFFEPWIIKPGTMQDIETHLASQGGLVDLIISASDELAAAGKSEEKLDTREILSSMIDEYIMPSRILNLDLMIAGKLDDEYPRRINQIDWRGLFQTSPGFFGVFAEELTSRYDFVLIDSRTGIADTSGIATMLLPEKLVLVFTPNMQSMTGLRKLARRAVAYRHNSEDFRPLTIFPLQSRVEDSEEELRSRWRFGDKEEQFQGYQKIFETLFIEVYGLSTCDLQDYFDEVKVQHVPAYSYGEEIAVEVEREKGRLSLTRSFERFTGILVGEENPWVAVKRGEESQRRRVRQSTYVAFISYSYRYREWVEILHSNLELCLANLGEERRVFLDQVDLGVGRSWISQLNEGLDRAEHFILVVTPEALASPRVSDEWESFIAKRRDWQYGGLQIVMLVDTPLPPFLESIQFSDFRDHDEAQYRQSLAGLLAGLLGRLDRRRLPELADSLQVPEAPTLSLPASLRQELIGWLAATLKGAVYRRAVADVLGLHHTAIEGFGSWQLAASSAVVQATGDDDPFAAALRIVEALREVLEEEEDGKLARLAERMAALKADDTEPGLVGAWLRKVTIEHERLLPYFQQGTEVTLLDRVYVQLQLGTGGGKAEESLGSYGPLGIRRLLDLDPNEHSWVSRRWVLLGDPGAGKTTLLRHLAADVARQRPAPWVPVFESLSRLMRQPVWLLDHIERQMKRAGVRADGLAAVLDRAGQEGRLLLLLDGLDDVPRELREEADELLRLLSGRWPRSPLIVSSRPIGYQRPHKDFQELELLPFGREQRREFLARWFGRASGEPDSRRAESAARVLEGDAGLRELASNPLYLTLMALLIEQGTSPARKRTDLYTQVFQLLLGGGYKYPRGEPMEAQAAVRRVLRYLAYEMTRENRDAEPVEALEARLYQPEADTLREPLERVPRWRRSLRPFLDDLAERTGILGPHDGPGADWRYWHRTFREALAAEALEERLVAEGGRQAVLEHARQIEDRDLSRWAEPFALLTGRVSDPDELVRALIQENRPLGLRALATAQGLEDETLGEVLELSEDWKERRKVYEGIPKLINEPFRALALIDRLRRRIRNGNDLFFLESAIQAVSQKWPAAQRFAQDLLGRLYDHLPAPSEDLFRWIEVRDGRVELWREIPAGSFVMGNPEGEEESYDSERPQHEVLVRSSFRMAAVPVTIAQYTAFDPEHRAQHRSRLHPVESVTWYEAYAFCRWLSSRLALTRGARLPSEEEWEYACRAGSQTRYWNGDDESDLAAVGWYGANAKGRTHQVGRRPANRWGLYDVHGNVWEWTASGWTDDYSGREAGVEVDPSAVDPADLVAPSGAGRVARGGSFRSEGRDARTAYRGHGVPNDADGGRGFRVCLPTAPEAT